jgi:RNA polymerase sigma-70 factor (ECF subfamily)
MSADQVPDAEQAAALRALVQEYAPAVLALCLVFVRNRDEAEDLAQETLLKATASIGELRDPQAFQAWILQIARRRCMNHLSRKKSLDPLPGDIQAPVPVEVDDTDVKRLRIALAEIPEDNRKVLCLHYLEGKTCASIGETLGVSEGAVRVRLTRARWVLRERLKETEE